VQALPVVAVGHDGLDDELVLARHVGQGQATVDEVTGIQGPAVEGGRGDGARVHVDPRPGPRRRAREAHDGTGPEDLDPPVEVEVDGDAAYVAVFAAK
jgi:hypothetical protein